MSKKSFLDLCQNFPDILIKMKKRALEYKDPWKRFKMKMLQEVDYFHDFFDENEFLEDVQYHMMEE